ncbi:MAG: hypothetical protein R3338_05060 [Thermoanaerobaculia bacterium]|nr:hypothetical protein [Thermoanaerobaculia bacterium]
MNDQRLSCSAPECSAEIDVPLGPRTSKTEPSAYDEQRATIARNHGWVMGRHSESGEIMQFCPTHRSGAIAGFAPF